MADICSDFSGISGPLSLSMVYVKAWLKSLLSSHNRHHLQSTIVFPTWSGHSGSWVLSTILMSHPSTMFCYIDINQE